jgi:hypothetical protein
MALVSLVEFKAYLDLSNSDTFTVGAGDLAGDTLNLSGTNKLWSTLHVADKVLVSVGTGGVLPVPLVAGTIYFVILGTDPQIQLATTAANAIAGTDIDLTAASTAPCYIRKALADDTVCQQALDAAEEYIEAETHRFFESTTQTRYYREDALWPNSRTLRLDNDLLTITAGGLLNGDTAATPIAATSYVLLPRNDAPPYHYIELTEPAAPLVTAYWEFDTDMWVSVAGTWGWSATPPADVKQAVLVLAAYFYRQKDSSIFDTTAIPGAGVITIPSGIPATVRKVIDKYRRYL